eukprot:gene17696-biopygen3881
MHQTSAVRVAWSCGCTRFGLKFHSLKILFFCDFAAAFYTVAPQAPHPVAPKAPQLAPKAPQIAPQAPQTAPKALKCQRIGKNACWCTIGISTTKAAGAFGHL